MTRRIEVDGSPTRVAALGEALAAALAGRGPTVLPVAAEPDSDRPVVPRPPPAAPDAASPAAAPSSGGPAIPPGLDDSPRTAPPGHAAVDAALMIATSGSTGGPKLVVLSAAALRASAAATAARLGGDAHWLLALPGEHIAGVQVIVRALLAGAPPAVQDLRGGFRAADFAATAATLPASGRRHTSLVPTQLMRLLDAGGAALEALCGFDAVLVGGAALDAALHTRARAAGVRVVTTYGMSETAGGCVYDGVPLDGVTVELEPDGRILIGGPTLADGYLDGPAFHGVFRTGDLGRWNAGRLQVLGRADDVIVTGGENVAPAAVERVLAAQPGIRGVCVVGVPDPEWGRAVVAAVVPGPDRASDDALRAAVRAELGRAAVPRRLVDVDHIPLRGIGKPDRAAVGRLVTVTSGPNHPHG